MPVRTACNDEYGSDRQQSHAYRQSYAYNHSGMLSGSANELGNHVYPTSEYGFSEQGYQHTRDDTYYTPGSVPACGYTAQPPGTEQWPQQMQGENRCALSVAAYPASWSPADSSYGTIPSTHPYHYPSPTYASYPGTYPASNIGYGGQPDGNEQCDSYQHASALTACGLRTPPTSPVQLRAAVPPIDALDPETVYPTAAACTPTKHDGIKTTHRSSKRIGKKTKSRNEQHADAAPSTLCYYCKKHGHTINNCRALTGSELLVVDPTARVAYVVSEEIYAASSATVGDIVKYIADKVNASTRCISLHYYNFVPLERELLCDIGIGGGSLVLMRIVPISVHFPPVSCTMCKQLHHQTEAAVDLTSSIVSHHHGVQEALQCDEYPSRKLRDDCRIAAEVVNKAIAILERGPELPALPVEHKSRLRTFEREVLIETPKSHSITPTSTPVKSGLPSPIPATCLTPGTHSTASPGYRRMNRTASGCSLKTQSSSPVTGQLQPLESQDVRDSPEVDEPENDLSSSQRNPSGEELEAPVTEHENVSTDLRVEYTTPTAMGVTGDDEASVAEAWTNFTTEHLSSEASMLGVVVFDNGVSVPPSPQLPSGPVVTPQRPQTTIVELPEDAEHDDSCEPSATSVKSPVDSTDIKQTAPSEMAARQRKNKLKSGIVNPKGDSLLPSRRKGRGGSTIRESDAEFETILRQLGEIKGNVTGQRTGTRKVHSCKEVKTFSAEQQANRQLATMWIDAVGRDGTREAHCNERSLSSSSNQRSTSYLDLDDCFSELDVSEDSSATHPTEQGHSSRSVADANCTDNAAVLSSLHELLVLADCRALTTDCAEETNAKSSEAASNSQQESTSLERCVAAVKTSRITITTLLRHVLHAFPPMPHFVPPLVCAAQSPVADPPPLIGTSGILAAACAMTCRADSALHTLRPFVSPAVDQQMTAGPVTHLLHQIRPYGVVHAALRLFDRIVSLVCRYRLMGSTMDVETNNAAETRTAMLAAFHVGHMLRTTLFSDLKVLREEHDEGTAELFAHFDVFLLWMELFFGEPLEGEEVDDDSFLECHPFFGGVAVDAMPELAAGVNTMERTVSRVSEMLRYRQRYYTQEPTPSARTSGLGVEEHFFWGLVGTYCISVISQYPSDGSASSTTCSPEVRRLVIQLTRQSQQCFQMPPACGAEPRPLSAFARRLIFCGCEGTTDDSAHNAIGPCDRGLPPSEESPPRVAPHSTSLLQIQRELLSRYICTACGCFIARWISSGMPSQQAARMWLTNASADDQDFGAVVISAVCCQTSRQTDSTAASVS